MTTFLEVSWGMTIEEAGELILTNEPWVMCWECNGTGREADNRNFQCSGCAGFKVILVRGYRIACKLLGKELPTPPSVEDAEAMIRNTEDLREFVDMVNRRHPGAWL